jgi:malate synthase
MMTIAAAPPENSTLINPASSTPEGFDPYRDLPAGFMDFLLPLHRIFTPRQQEIALKRVEVLQRSLEGEKPTHHFPSDTVRNGWKIQLPEWCQDQRNQMTGPADDGELCIKMLNSGAPGVMLDLEDSCVNEWTHHETGVANILACLRGQLSYYDKKRQRTVTIQPSSTVVFTRPRGLHLNQAGVIRGELVSASLIDVCRIFFSIDPAELKHPVCFYIPKSESAEEAFWWRDLFQALAKWRGLPHNYIKCMALVESHPLAFQMEQFVYNLRDHIIGLNLGRWDYMASLIHFNLDDPD